MNAEAEQNNHFETKYFVDLNEGSYCVDLNIGKAIDLHAPTNELCFNFVKPNTMIVIGISKHIAFAVTYKLITNYASQELAKVMVKHRNFKPIEYDYKNFDQVVVAGEKFCFCANEKKGLFSVAMHDMHKTICFNPLKYNYSSSYNSSSLVYPDLQYKKYDEFGFSAVREDGTRHEYKKILDAFNNADSTKTDKLSLKAYQFNGIVQFHSLVARSNALIELFKNIELDMVRSTSYNYKIIKNMKDESDVYLQTIVDALVFQDNGY